MLRDLVVKDMQLIGQGNHLKLFLQTGNFSFECVWWGKGELKDEIKFGANVDIAFRPSLNVWNGFTRMQLVLEDMAPAD
jgi:single-stranded-DNA-specific exonuclease